MLAGVLLFGGAGCGAPGAASIDGGQDIALPVTGGPLRLDPAEAQVFPGQTVTFTVLECDRSTPAICAPTGRPFTRWAVENMPGGTPALGTLTVVGSTALYKAPASRPTPNPVTVSVQDAGPGPVTTLTAKVTVGGQYHVEGQIDARAYMGLCALYFAIADVHGTFSFDLELRSVAADVFEGDVKGWTDQSTVKSAVTSVLPMIPVTIDGAPELFTYTGPLIVQSTGGTGQRFVLTGQRTSAGCAAHYPGQTMSIPAQTLASSLVFEFAPAGKGPWMVTATRDLPWTVAIVAR